MKYPLLTGALLLGIVPAALAQDLTNNGAAITLTGGVILSVGGSLTNGSGTLDLSSGSNNVYVGGNLTNAAVATLTPGTSSTVTLNGTAAQQLSLNGAALANLTVTNITGVSLPANSNADVSGTLTLTSGMVSTDASATLRLLSGATLTGEQSGQYVRGNLAAVKASVPVGGATFPNGFALKPTVPVSNLTVVRRAGLATAQVSYGTNGSGTTKGIDRIWQTSAPVDGQVQLTWLADNDNGLLNFTQSQVWARAAAPVAGADWTRVSPSQDAASTRSVTSTVPVGSSFSFFTVSTTEAPLPVTLTQFTAQASGRTVQLAWQTASEISSSHFVVERSVDGHTFTAVQTVAAAGTSAAPRAYIALDAQAGALGVPQLYYRLRSVDLDGTSTYSPVQAVTVTPAAAGLALFPNPASRATTLTGAAASAPIQVIDALGRIVATATADTIGTAELTLLTDLASGVYIVRTGSQALRLLVH